MPYEYELRINGITKRNVNSSFKPNIIAEIVKDLDRIDANNEQIIFEVTKRYKR